MPGTLWLVNVSHVARIQLSDWSVWVMMNMTWCSSTDVIGQNDMKLHGLKQWDGFKVWSTVVCRWKGRLDMCWYVRPHSLTCRSRDIGLSELLNDKNSAHQTTWAFYCWQINARPSTGFTEIRFRVGRDQARVQALKLLIPSHNLWAIR